MVNRLAAHIVRYRGHLLGVVVAVMAGALAAGCGSLADTPGTPGAGGTPAATAIGTLVEPTPGTPPIEATVPAEPTPAVGVTPVGVTPVPAATARPDCPPGWLANPETALSFCFPAGLKVLRGTAAGFTSYNVFTPEDDPGSPAPIFVVLSLESTRNVDPAASCEGASGLYGAHDFATQQIDVHGVPVTACVASGNDGGGTARSIMLSIPEGSGYLNMSALYRGDDSGSARASVEAILQSVEIQ